MLCSCCRVASFVLPDRKYVKKIKIIAQDHALSHLKWPWELKGMRLDKLMMLGAEGKWGSDEWKERGASL